ncbi:SixA phosphatase family protein [Bizionia sediminis]|uniref:SixA phosphatase family protein n=1 Tax=Bizionia sediminis TaxID=1737064 RepID=A0ABW5KR06_9FLAO
MKTLSLVRHAKSSWKLDLPDALRPLNKRGLKDAAKMSSYLKALHFKPDFLIASNAERAKHTAKIFIDTLNLAPDICKFTHELYDFSGSYVMLHIKECPNHVNHLVVFGHNHAITHIANTLGDKYIDNVPTCGVVTINFDVLQWQAIKKGITTQFLFPKGLNN